jgi:hypothetical protein
MIRPVAVNDARLTSSNVAETDYTAYNAGATYAQGDYVRVVAADVHKIYRSVQGSNTGHAVTDTAWWLEIGPTNRWKMFDQAVNTQTENSDSIVVVLAPGVLVNAIALLNVSAATIQITVTDPTDGVVYDETINMVSGSGILSWYDWFFEPIVRSDFHVATDLPPYPSATITVTLSDPGATVACGALIIGQQRDLGETLFNPAVGIHDYSVKEQDDFGNFSITERAYSKRGSFELWVDRGFQDELVRLLTAYRATPIVYVGLSDLGSTVIYGFFKDFTVVLRYPRVSFCSIDIEGLT